MRKWSLYLIIAIGLLVTACTATAREIRIPQESVTARDLYSEAMNPLLQRHGDIMSALSSQMGAAVQDELVELIAAGNRDEAIQVMTNIRDGLGDVRDELNTLANDWVLLQPAEKDEDFHQVVFAMMQADLGGIRLVKVAFDTLYATGGFDSDAMIKGTEMMEEGERLWLQVLAEARKLGGVEITDARE